MLDELHTFKLGDLMREHGRSRHGECAVVCGEVRPWIAQDDATRDINAATVSVRIGGLFRPVRDPSVPSWEGLVTARPLLRASSGRLRCACARRARRRSRWAVRSCQS
jgi:hypothetical protein